MKKNNLLERIAKTSKLIFFSKFLVLIIGKNFFLRILEFIEIRSAFLQGKGYGSVTNKNEFKCVASLIGEITLAFDIGAYKGEYTLEILNKYPKCNMHLFEPAKLNFEYLKKKFANMDNIVLNNYAVSDKNTDSLLHSNNKDSVLSSLIKRDLSHLNVNFDFTEKVKVLKLDDYINKNNLNNIDFIKIDCEGVELSILQGLSNNLKKIKCFQFEFGSCNIDSNTNFKQFFDLFINNNFSIYRITPFGNYIINNYNELNEFYMTTNYIALNNKLS